MSSDRATANRFLLGLALNGFPKYDLTTIRIPGVLQRIALCYLAGAAVFLYTKWRGQLAAIVAGTDEVTHADAIDAEEEREFILVLGHREDEHRAEDVDAEALTLLVKQTVAWQGVALGDDLLECTEANVRRVYTEFPWIRQQVDTFVNDISNYLGN